MNTRPEPSRRAPPKLLSEPHLFVVLDCDAPERPPSRHSLAGRQTLTVGRADDGVRRLDDDGAAHTLRLADEHVSTTHARIGRADDGGWHVEDADSRNGTRLNGRPLAAGQRAALADGDLVECGHTLLCFRAAVATSAVEPRDLDAAALSARPPELVSLLPSLAGELGRLAEVARSALSVVLTGESGTGKEVMAQAIHRLSGRAGRFVAINCGAIAPNLVESELFGYKKGAFSGADEERAGLVRSADGGTLFLDEIGDLPLGSQTALLRVLQEREVTPIGGTRPIKVDLRVVAATHRDLKAMVARNQFRGDLLARLSGMRLELPPLRARREDLGLLIARLLGRLGPPGAPLPSLRPEAARRLFAHEWPFNVRELEQGLAAARVLAGDGPIEVEHVERALDLPPSAETDAADPAETSAPAATARSGDGAATRREQLVALLREHRGNVTEVARALDMSRMQVHRWLKQLDLDPAEFRP